MGTRVAVPKEVTPGERRVSLVPETVGKLVKAGMEIKVESDAGAAAFYPDSEYITAGGTIEPDRTRLFREAAVVLHLQPPSVEEIGWMKPGTIVVSLLNPPLFLTEIARMRDAGITAFSLQLLPRISRAQSMDALSSQATVAGYRAAIVASELCPRFFPMLTTAAGTIRPARVLILGAGVAGLMAIATSKRLGAIVEAYDVRRAAGEQVRSLGAKFLELAINAEGTGGYARELKEEEKNQERAMVAKAVAEADVVITTANVPGRKAPQLVSREMVTRMKPGAVIIDLAAESGGNCELTRPGEQFVEGGVTIVGPLNLSSQVPFHASQMYSKNLQSFLSLLVDSAGTLIGNYDDEILRASLLVQAGEVTHAPTRELLAGRK